MVNPAVGEDSLGPMERGRKKYFHKDYAGALAAFTEVGRSIEPSIKLDVA